MSGFKSKTIASIISRKITAWAQTIDDDQLAMLADKHAIVTGGCITSMLLGEKVNDFDIYFSDVETAYALADYYLSKMKVKAAAGVEAGARVVRESVENGDPERIKIFIKSAGVASEKSDDEDTPEYKYFEADETGRSGERYLETIADVLDTEDDKQPEEKGVDNGDLYHPVFASTNAITLSHKIQLIFRFWGDPAEIHKNYDFVHCTNYWTRDTGLVLNKDALQACLSKELVYIGSKYPVCSIFRTRKFIQREWRITAGQLLKMAWQISELDLSNIEVLEEQLTGVDVAYFNQLIADLRENGMEKVDRGYLFKLIDRVM